MKIALALLLCGFAGAWHTVAASQPTGIPLMEPGFDRTRLMRQSTPSLFSAERFSVANSYSMRYSTNGSGSSTSDGLFLSTLSWQLASPLVLSLDLGMYNLFTATGAYAQGGPVPEGQPNFIIPRIGLDWQATQNLSFSLSVLNGADAAQAYGSPYGGFGGSSGFGGPGSYSSLTGRGCIGSRSMTALRPECR